MIAPDDWDLIENLPPLAQSLGVWLWLHLDPLGRGPMDPDWIGATWGASPSLVETTLLELMEAEFLTTYRADGQEWILLLHPLKTDLRRTPITTPEPPTDRPWTSMAVGGAGARGSARAGGRARARERARAQVRAERDARADAWAAVASDRAAPPELPERPFLLDAPPMFCPDHMPGGAGKESCGPCRDARLIRDEFVQTRIYEQKLTTYYQQTEGDDDEPF